jgi:hypothetical protein
MARRTRSILLLLSLVIPVLAAAVAWSVLYATVPVGCGPSLDSAAFGGLLALIALAPVPVWLYAGSLRRGWSYMLLTVVLTVPAVYIALIMWAAHQGCFAT